MTKESVMAERKAAYPILDLIRDRWSARAMSGEPLSHEELYTLFEAARWAPSSYNNQPWTFIWADRDSSDWEIFLGLLVEPNRVWAQQAGVLLVVLSRTLFFYNDTYSRTHSFDTGAAVENLALQGHAMGLVVHGMEGFDYERARVVLEVPQEYTIEAMFVLGKPGPLSVLSEDLRKREMPSDRKPVDQFIFRGRFGRINEE